MQTLIILNRNPYDGTDVTWNALRLAEQLLNADVDVRLFLMNDSVDLAREGIAPQQYDFNLGEMLVALMDKGVPVKVCGTCMVRCGFGKNNSLLKGAVEAKMPELADWVKQADSVISFQEANAAYHYYDLEISVIEYL